MFDLRSTCSDKLCEQNVEFLMSNPVVPKVNYSAKQQVSIVLNQVS